MSFLKTLETYVDANPDLGVIVRNQINKAISIYNTVEDESMAKNALNPGVRESIFGKGNAKGGYVKKYARGGGVRKVKRYG